MILIGNGPVITRDPRCPFIECGGLIIKNNRIIEVGQWDKMQEVFSVLSQEESPLIMDDEIIDVDGKIIMPGMINAHHHIYSAYARGLILPGHAPAQFIDILDGVWWKIDRNLSLEHTYYSGIASYMDSVQNGVTTVVDHHASYKAVTGSLDQLAKSAKKLGIRTCLAYEISDRDGQGKMKEAVDENISFISKLHRVKPEAAMINGLVGLHASFTLSDETMAYIKKKNTDYSGYHIHIGEGIEDEEHCQRTYGCSVVERLNKLGILGEKTIAGHCIHVSEEDLDILRETQTTIIHNPESNMANGVGSPDVLAMMDKGIMVGLGSDGYTSDMLESAKVANILQKHHHSKGDRGFVEAATMLFNNNPAIVSHLMGDLIGALSPGALGDVVVMDYTPTTPLDETNINGHILFGMQGAMTDTTIINGKIIYKNRKFMTVDKELLLSESRKAAEGLWRELTHE